MSGGQRRSEVGVRRAEARRSAESAERTVPGTPEDTCSNCKGSGWDSTQHFDDQPAEPHACGYCQGGTYSGQLATPQSAERQP
jgi:DnaJ-class molecular chaperone